MDLEEPFLVVVDETGSLVELRDPFHRRRPYKVVMQLSSDAKTVSEYHEVSMFDRNIAGFFVRKSVPTDRDDVFRYSVECFVDGATVGDVSVVFAAISTNRVPDLKLVLPFVVDTSGFCVITCDARTRTVCGVCLFPDDCITKQVWPRVTSSIGSTYSDGYTTIKLPNISNVDWGAVDARPKLNLLRDTTTHTLRGICSNRSLVDSLKPYVFDEFDHMGFLQLKEERETYSDLCVDEGTVRMIREEDFCAIYKDEQSSEFYLVVYMRLPDAIEDQLFHLLVDNALTRDWVAWARSEEIVNAHRYSEARRRAVGSYCFRNLLQCDTFRDVTENQKCKLCSSLEYRSVAYNVLLAESDCFLNARQTIRHACFYKNAYNLNMSSGYALCELFESAASPTALPRLITCKDNVPLLAKKPSLATAIPRYVHDGVAFSSLIDSYSRNRSNDLATYVFNLTPVNVLVPKFRIERSD
ncbi:hypothetical protein CYMTET_3886 [Cymbomonas tetramitiformis]|uniref:Uncharacterized protein n=1 Tax=Cymbomonas tetramitiformis TaxID=36881 RepID=A0AAE0H2D6_9CHLO|nr:hypothetical protein CYMTET_3886 [Cymbomonas tetramitiformis]